MRPANPPSAATVRKVTCDTRIVPGILGEPLDDGRAARTIPPAIRCALVIRERHCAFTHCTRPACWTDGPHITHWANGGATALHNPVHP